MSRENAEDPAVYLFDGYRVDVAKRLVYDPNGKTLALKAKAFETLLFLVENPGRVIERDEIMSAVWPDTVVEENNLTQHISSLRRLFGETKDDHRYIITAPGRGYKFAADVSRAGARAGAPPDSHKQEPQSRTWFIALATATLLLVVGSLYTYKTSLTAKVPIKKIAVLPLKPLSEQDRIESLQMGLANDLITKLSGAEGMSVFPLTSTIKFSSSGQDAIAAGRELGVDAVLDGNYQVSSDRAHVTVMLYTVADSKELWVQPFDAPFSATGRDFFDIQNEIAEKVADSLAVRLNEYATKRYKSNLPAYSAYQKGQMRVFRFNPDDIQQAIAYFHQAIVLDRNYALAYVGLAQAHRSLVLSGEFPPAESIKQSMDAAKQAVAIDPNLSEGHASLALGHYWFEYNWDESETAYQQSIKIDPRSAYARIYYAHLLSTIGRHEQAIVEAEKAVEIEPSWAIMRTFQGLVYEDAGMHDKALTSFNEAEKLDPHQWLPHLFATVTYIDQHRYDEAIDEAKKASERNTYQTNSWAYESFALAKAGRLDQARQRLDDLIKRSNERYVPPYHLAVAYAGLGETENVFKCLENAYSDHDPKMVFLKVHPFWDDLRSEPRFIELMQKMNFP